MRTVVLLTLVALAGGSSCAGCRGSSESGRVRGELVVLSPGPDGALVTSRDATFDFGNVFMGQVQTVKVVVKNLGRGPLTLERLDRESGAVVSIGEDGVDKPVFRVGFTPTSLGVEEQVEVEVRFEAPTEEGQRQVAHEAVLLLRALNAPEGEDLARITLKGTAVSGVCEVPRVLDFGEVAIGDTVYLSHVLRNPSPVATTGSVGELTSSAGDEAAFSFAPESAKGTVPMPAGATRTVSVGFSPLKERQHLALVKLRAAEQCPELGIQLVGRGVSSPLTFDPPEVDFGYVSPGYEVQRTVTVRNGGVPEAVLSELSIGSPSEFKVVAGADGAVSLPGRGGTRTLTLAFKPSVLGKRASALAFKTNLAAPSKGSLPLVGHGGGAEIQLSPSPVLAFGRVAFFEGAPSPQVRRLSVLNVGTRPEPPDERFNLRLGKGGLGGPYWEIKPLNAESPLSEIEILLPPAGAAHGYDPARGLEATSGKNQLDLTVRLTPGSASPRAYEVTIFSNSQRRPVTKVTVTAAPEVLPPCQYKLAPSALRFGLVTPPQYKDLSFTFTNLGHSPAERCLVSKLDFEAGSDPSFTLPGGSTEAVEVAAGASLTIPVRVEPRQQSAGLLTLTGALRVYVSSPGEPMKRVALEAQLTQPCLTIAPGDLDFGVVKAGCASTARTFSIYNTCASEVVLKAIAFQNAAGQPAGGPQCPGPSACPEFHVKAPFIPAAGLRLPPRGGPTTFRARYAPLDVGADTGALAVSVLQNGLDLTYLVTLSGEGDLAGANRDDFVQDAKPKADILLVVDNSGSMQDKQQALAENFDAFIKYANDKHVDYHIAVTTTDMRDNGERGRFVSGPTHPETVLTPYTDDVTAKFKAKVNVGTEGSGEEHEFDPALAALTAPLITTVNAGFLRREAALAIVAVTDDVEQSTDHDVQYFLDSFLNIKGTRNSNQFSFNAIFGDFASAPEGCTATPDDGRFTEMVTRTNGVKESICTPDWARALERLGKAAFGFRTNFFLTAYPDLTGGAQVVVKIDGLKFEKVDDNGAPVWSYDPVANSVNFQPNFVPEAGQTLSIEYAAACLTDGAW